MSPRFCKFCVIVAVLVPSIVSAQAPLPGPVRPNAGFAMVYPGQSPPPGSSIPVIPTPLPPAPPIHTGTHPHWGPTWTNTGSAGIPAVEGMQQPKYGYNAYPFPGHEGMKLGLHQGCANPITCGNFWSDATFVFGSCRQYFGHGRGCGGWFHPSNGENGSPTEGTGTSDCPSCSTSYWGKK